MDRIKHSDQDVHTLTFSASSCVFSAERNEQTEPALGPHCVPHSESLTG